VLRGSETTAFVLRCGEALSFEDGYVPHELEPGRHSCRPGFEDLGEAAWRRYGTATTRSRRNASRTCDNAIDQLSQRLLSLGAGPYEAGPFFGLGRGDGAE
jgi:hypothetical protein